MVFCFCSLFFNENGQRKRGGNLFYKPGKHTYTKWKGIRICGS
ncbi:hypothetical protein HMPREF0083_05180 [Aneurinibacillus aneurinilyticus ATCC 12856]|uniref:Uncharacterized protein n=1 Tax=Aneurinibacillus aneurinilyticus ATCC 12856 TaxID=649747 RepID=U1WX53_ANEAE|nr:hypothetical protein HMPREF0083_05180 [Aneurinibacillus aneurinilyticus ATCC 12856]